MVLASITRGRSSIVPQWCRLNLGLAPEIDGISYHLPADDDWRKETHLEAQLKHVDGFVFG